MWFKTPERPLLQNTSSFLILSEGIERYSDVFIVKFGIISKLFAVAVASPYIYLTGVHFQGELKHIDNVNE